jgi:hypothetical protein
MHEIVPFPLARRLDFIERHARLVASMSADVGEGHIQRQLEIQRQTLARKGVAAPAIEHELNSLASAIRAALWRVVLTNGGRM